MSTYFLKSHRIDLTGQCVEIAMKPICCRSFASKINKTYYVNLPELWTFMCPCRLCILGKSRPQSWHRCDEVFFPTVNALSPPATGVPPAAESSREADGFRVRQEEVLLEVGHTRVRVVAHRALERRGCRLTVVRLAVGVQRGDTGADFRTLGALELVSWSCGKIQLDNITNSLYKSIRNYSFNFCHLSLQLVYLP